MSVFYPVSFVDLIRASLLGSGIELRPLLLERGEVQDGEGTWPYWCGNSF